MRTVAAIETCGVSLHRTVGHHVTNRCDRDGIGREDAGSGRRVGERIGATRLRKRKIWKQPENGQRDQKVSDDGLIGF